MSLFKKRYPELVLRKADSLERARAEALYEDILNEYFDLLHKCLESNYLLHHLERGVVASRGSKNAYRQTQTQGTTEHITMICCTSAAGLSHPPMIIFAKSFPGGPYRFDGLDDALYAKSESGWIDSELFLSWFNKIFLRYCVPEHSVMLLTDGHKSHMT